MITFNEAVERVLQHEGGYVNHPNDPGGETNFGISKRSYPDVDIKNLTREGAKEIYFRDFWCPVAKGLYGPVVFQAFDAAVNHGIGNSIRMLQRAVGVLDDGHWGPISRAAYEKMSGDDVAINFLAERLDFVRRLSRFDTFGRGWVKRIVDNLRHYSQDNNT